MEWITFCNKNLLNTGISYIGITLKTCQDLSQLSIFIFFTYNKTKHPVKQNKNKINKEISADLLVQQVRSRKLI